MNENFLQILKRTGRSEAVAERVMRLVNVFCEFHLGLKSSSPENAAQDDLDAFIAYAEKEKDHLPKHDDISPSPKSYLWAIRYYYQYTKNPEMETYAGLLREARIKRRPFAIKKFRGVDPDHLQKLENAGILNINQMLKAGKTDEMRRQLGKQTGIPHQKILELVRLSDLARIPGIKNIRARLYHDAGIDTVAKMASMPAEEILALTTKFVQDTDFDGIPPLPAEVRYRIKKAKSLPKVIEI